MIATTTFHIDDMLQSDVSEVGRIERRCFHSPWPQSAYRRELRNPRQNHYVVLRALPDPEDSDKFGLDREHSALRISDLLRQRFPQLHLPRRGAPPVDGPHIAGFAGMWCLYDEAHVTTIGVDPFYRGRGFGELLLVAMFDEAIHRGANFLTLEVRVSNQTAQRLYAKYGMIVQTTRKRYYSDNEEDAYVMWSRSLRDRDYLARIENQRERLRARLGPGVRYDDTSWVPRQFSSNLAFSP